jgi:hypothetical protein
LFWKCLSDWRCGAGVLCMFRISVRGFRSRKLANHAHAPRWIAAPSSSGVFCSGESTTTTSTRKAAVKGPPTRPRDPAADCRGVVKVKPRGGRRSAADSPSLEGFNGSEHAPSSKDRRGPRFLSHLHFHPRTPKSSETHCSAELLESNGSSAKTIFHKEIISYTLFLCS